MEIIQATPTYKTETVNSPTGIVYDAIIAYIATFFCVLFIAVGIFGNLVTILALVRSPKLLRCATTVFVINLCVTYVMFCSICLPLTAARFIYQRWVFGVAACVFYPFFFYGNFAASLMSMVVITINRYILIVHSRIYSRLYRRWCIVLWLVFVWVFSFGMMLPPLAGWWGEYGYNNRTFSCTINAKNGSSPKKFLFMFGFAMPCAVIILCYTIIYWYVRRSKRRSSITQGARRAGRTPEEMKLTRMTLIIFCTFVLCFLPLTITNVALEEDEVPTLHVMASISAWFSAVINPFIYAAMNKTYRKAYKAIMPKPVRRLWACQGFCCWQSLFSIPTVTIDGVVDGVTRSTPAHSQLKTNLEMYPDSGLGNSRTPSPRYKRDGCNRNGHHLHMNNHIYFNCNNNNMNKGEKRNLNALDPEQVDVHINQLDLPSNGGLDREYMDHKEEMEDYDIKEEQTSLTYSNNEEAEAIQMVAVGNVEDTHSDISAGQYVMIYVDNDFNFDELRETDIL